MPIEKLEKPRATDIDPSSITLNMWKKKVLCCCECGETRFTLRGVKDESGKRVRPSKYICQECYRRNGNGS